LELFKEKEEQEVENKNFDPESGIEVTLDLSNLSQINLNQISADTGDFQEEQTEPNLNSELSKLDHGVYDEEETTLDLMEVLKEELENAEKIFNLFSENETDSNELDDTNMDIIDSIIIE